MSIPPVLPPPQSPEPPSPSHLMEKSSDHVRRGWKRLSWLAVLLFLSVGVWWLFFIPTVGKGGVLLAVGATLMPLFWDKVGSVGKMFWVAMLFVLLGVEYRAIDKEQQESAHRQQEELKKIGDGFENVLTSQQTSFSTLITQSQTNFDSLIQDERKNFKQIMDNSVKAQQKANTNFLALLRQEKELLIHQKELYEYSSNKLVPASEPMPPNSCPSNLPGDVFIFLGDHGNAAVMNQFPNTILRVKGNDVITIDRGDEGSLVLSVDMRDASGRMIASLGKNGFVVSKTYELYMLRPDLSTVLIEDAYGKELLRAKFINPKAFVIKGKIQYQDKVVPLDIPGAANVCFAHAGKGGAEIVILY
jgi:hypothetical protein